jgi:hypothetical protein
MAFASMHVRRSHGHDHEHNITWHVVSLLLGAWVFVSAFLWHHLEPQRTNTWVVGALMTCIALLCMAIPKARYVNTLLSAWLFISAFSLPSETAATILCNALAGLAVFVISLSPTMAREVPLYHRARMRHTM